MSITEKFLKNYTTCKELKNDGFPYFDTDGTLTLKLFFEKFDF